ncbi:MAG: hypothetical protein HYY06_02890 [Deltaproteobacteria bacterium]|nr:hypothetical protein [Deltaproteobacteria bacterium]
MQKIQILFPEPLMHRLRRVAREEDQAVSEVVRRATEAWLERKRYLDAGRGGPVRQPPSFRGGRVKLPAARLREAAYSDREAR